MITSILLVVCFLIVLAISVTVEARDDDSLPVGTRSLLFGAHQVFLHPWFVAAAWWKLYGFPFDPRLWVAFFVHDLGYWGKRDMDGPEGERHVELGAKIVHSLFDTPRFVMKDGSEDWSDKFWRDFCLYHSRFYAKKDGKPFSRLCVADKLAICLTPAWLYIPLARLSGELDEYMARADGKYKNMNMDRSSVQAWRDSMCAYLERWCEAHKDGGEDRWTQA